MVDEAHVPTDAPTNGKIRLCGRPRVTDGQPCEQRLGDYRDACPWHDPDLAPADRQALARKGGLVATGRLVLPADTPAPRGRARSQIVAWLEKQARYVLIGQLDPRIAGEARLHAETALRAYELGWTEKLDAY